MHLSTQGALDIASGRAGKILAQADRPVMMAGSWLYLRGCHLENFVKIVRRRLARTFVDPGSIAFFYVVLIEKTLENESSTLVPLVIVRVLGYLCRALPRAAQWCQERVYSTGEGNPLHLRVGTVAHGV